MKTIFTCTAGHQHAMSEDLGDPADREQVMRWEGGMRGNVFFWECPTLIEDKRCGCKMTRTTEETSSDYDPYY